MQMRMSELSRESEVPIPTIKYYLREGLLQPGHPTAPNQAEYDEDHVRRLRLIRVLVEVGGLGISAVRAVTQAIEDEGLPFHEVLGVAQRALVATPDAASPQERGEVDTFLNELGWHVSSTAPGRAELADALAALRGMGWDVTADSFGPYAAAVAEVAAREVQTIDSARSRSEAVERLVLGTVVFERVLTALRRLAHEHHSALRFGAGKKK